MNQHCANTVSTEAGTIRSVNRTGSSSNSPWGERVIPIDLPEGLHARPAGRLVALLIALEVDVRVRNLATGAGPVSARSLTSLATLGVLRGQAIHVTARGRDAVAALAAIEALAARGFDEAPSPPIQTHSQKNQLEPPGEAIVGQAAARGVAVAPARRVHRRATGRKRDVGAPDHEAGILRSAIAAVGDELRLTRDVLAAQAGAVHAEILDTQIMVLSDEALSTPAFLALSAAGVSAETAWADVTGAVATRYRALPDAYQRARASDIEEIGRLVIARIAGAAQSPTLWGAGVLIADDLGPAETAALDLTLIRGIATARGGPTSHTAILARALGIPAVVGLGPAVMTTVEGTQVLLDGDAGTLTIDPHPAIIAARSGDKSVPDPSSVEEHPSTPGLDLEVGANIGLAIEMKGFRASGADSIGLLRSEMLFLGHSTTPTVEDHHRAYTEVCVGANGRRVTIRTLDSGADKPLPFLPEPPSANTALGVRGLRRSLLEPELLHTQVRAILRVAAKHPVRIMFPMISTVGEWRRAADIVEREIDALGWNDRRPNGLEIGVMVEVPAAAICAEAFASEVDFFSIGTNDLAQYVMAADRTNPATSPLADALHPAVLRLIGEVCGAADAEQCSVGVCGEIAGDPLALPILVGLGVDSLSVSPSLVGEVKRLAGRIDLDAARVLAGEAVGLASAEEVREHAARFLARRSEHV